MLSEEMSVRSMARDSSPLKASTRGIEEERTQYLQQKDYDKAKAVHESFLDSIKKYYDSIRVKERERQQAEMAKLEKASEMLLIRNDEKWRSVLKEAESKWEEKLDALRDKHQNELEKLLVRMEAKERARHFALSAEVRDLLRVERRLAEGHEYDDAKVLHKRIQKREEEEHIRNAAQREAYRQSQIQRLQERQQEERWQLEMHIKNERTMLTRRCLKAHQTLLQKTSNLKADMKHAHQMEFQAVAQSGITVPPAQQKRLAKLTETRLKLGNPHGCAPGQIATYRGTQMLVRTQGKYPLVSLCSLYDPECPGPPLRSGAVRTPLLTMTPTSA
eukprot:RCo026996